MEIFRYSPHFSWILWNCITFLNGCRGTNQDTEVRLINDLLKDYDLDARPVKNRSDPVSVELRISYRELKELNEPKQSMTSEISFEIGWKDASLQWNVSDYEGISTLRLDPSRVWKPDLTLINSISREGRDLYHFETKVIVESDGTMRWFALGMLESSCKVKMSKFPFDEQACLLTIGSWTYNGLALQLHFHKKKELAELIYYRENSEWELLSANAKQNIVEYECCPAPYYHLIYTVHFRRKPLYYIMSLVVPCIFLSVIASISFLFPADSGERVSLVMSVFLGLIVFMLIVNDKTPVTSDTVPMITLYFTGIGFITFSSLVATAFILWMHHSSSSHPVPHYLSKMSRLLAAAFCLGGSGWKTSGQRDLGEVLLTDGKELSFVNELSVYQNTGNMEKILNEIQRFAMRQKDDDRKEELKEEWQCTAKVFDRLFFRLFFLACVSLNVYILTFLT